MKETDFVEQNKDKWAQFEALSKQNNNDPDKISELFTEITEDLSYARTFYPRRSVRVYLNNLAQGVFTSLYKQKKQPVKGFIKYWTEAIPLAVYRSRKNMIMALIFFSAAVLLGAVSQHFDESFANIILGNGYLESTETRIAEGNPMGIYGERSETDMFFSITINNIRVAFIAFVLGIFFSFGSYIILLTNGIMLGAFQWWFYSKGLLLTSFLAIWIHGAFEISAIIIAGAAGITLGNGLLFPKSYSRLQSLIFSAKQGFTILMSLVPIFIIAGTLESFVTRYYQTMPFVLNWFIILGSFATVILYYGFLPFLVARKYPDKTTLREMPRHIPIKKIKIKTIRTTGEIFSDSVHIFIQRVKSFLFFSMKLVIPMALIIVIIVSYLQYYDLSYSNDWHYNFQIIFGFDSHFRVYKFFGWSFILSIATSLTIYILNHKKKSIFDFVKKTYRFFPWLVLFTSTSMIAYVFLNWLLLLILIIFGGFLLQFVPIVIFTEKINIFKAISRSFSLIKSGFGQAVSNSLAMIAISVIFFFILHNPMEIGILKLIDDFLANIFVGNTTNAYLIINLFNTIVYLFYIMFIVQLFYVNGYYFYHSQLEKETADELKSSISTIGKRSKSFETKIDFE